MTIKNAIEKILTQTLQPSVLEVLDESVQHRGHQHFDRDTETHFCIRIVCQKFHGLKPIERQRMVYALLSPFWQQGVHAIRFDLRADSDDE